MCGIFGLRILPDVETNFSQIKRIVELLHLLSESRGKEAAGIAIGIKDELHVYKEARAASRMIAEKAYQQWFFEITRSAFDRRWHLKEPLTIIGHSRLVTNGSMLFNENNQPVIAAGLVGIHNGIIVNDEQLRQLSGDLDQHAQVDTEAMLCLLRHYYREAGELIPAVQKAFALLEGTASMAVLFEDLAYLLLATNNGSLYTAANENKSLQVFASEKQILREGIRRTALSRWIASSSIVHLEAGEGLLIDTGSSASTPFSLLPSDASRGEMVIPANTVKKSIQLHVNGNNRNNTLNATTPYSAVTVLPSSRFKRFEIDTRPIQALRRCTKCILPETMPFIEFDEEGVCNYCRHYPPLELPGVEALLRDLEPYRSKGDEPDCLVALSGGRDSSYGLHYLKNELHLKPIAYTYDWGMVTDLARRNQARLCGKLGVEHILISADIQKKRSYIRKNVMAWLKQPDLGTVPLFMAGDKQFFYYANKLKKQCGAKVTLLCINPLERTSFKTGFCGFQQPESHVHHYALSLTNQLRLAFYYVKQYIKNPAYINDSLLDTIGAFISYYIIPHTFLNLYNYIAWDEETITRTLRELYDWEVAKDTRSTWRIGDGTASFYNYIYYYGAGFTENDTFRSNQIREGMITREEALARVAEENQPRWDSIQWYCETIGLDVFETLERIQTMEKRY